MRHKSASNDALKENLSGAINETLENEFKWFESYLDYFFNTYFETSAKVKPALPVVEKNDDLFAKLLLESKADYEDRVIIMLALTPHIKPQLLDLFYTKNRDYDDPFQNSAVYKVRHIKAFCQLLRQLYCYLPKMI